MITINWNPSPTEMRHWAVILAVALGLVGALFYFVNWGVFANGQAFAKCLWGFGAIALLTGVTGTKFGLPAYWLWMGFVYLISSLIGYTALMFVHLGVITPMALLARSLGRDKLQLRLDRETSYWHQIPNQGHHDPERQF
jgi:hypothetical protein